MQQDMHIRFHNPNTEKETADLVWSVFLEAGRDKLLKELEELAAAYAAAVPPPTVP